VAPPSSEVLGPALSWNRFGKGSAIFVSAPLFGAFSVHPNPNIKELVRSLLGLLDGEPLLIVEAPPLVEAVLTREGEALNLHLVNHQGERFLGGESGMGHPLVESIPVIGPVRVRLRTEKKPKEVVLHPEKRRLPFTYRNGYAECLLEKLHIHSCLEFVVPR
jgi:hypothetical protein